MSRFGWILSLVGILCFAVLAVRRFADNDPLTGWLAAGAAAAFLISGAAQQMGIRKRAAAERARGLTR
jgi:HD superfamily phosphodiesterase